MARLVTLAAAYCVNLIYEANIVAVNLMGVDAHDGAWRHQLRSGSDDLSRQPYHIPHAIFGSLLYTDQTRPHRDRTLASMLLPQAWDREYD